VNCSVLRYVAVCCSVFQCFAVCCSGLQCGVLCCSASQCVAQVAGGQQTPNETHIRRFESHIIPDILKKIPLKMCGTNYLVSLLRNMRFARMVRAD